MARASNTALRVVVQQPALPGYRVPVFRSLSRRFHHDVKVLASADSHVPYAAAEGFDVEESRTRSLALGALGSVWWEPAQWSAAGALADIDVLVLSWNIRNLSLVPAIVRARQNGIATVVWGHGYSKREVRSGLVAHARDAAASLADAVLFYDEHTAERFRARTGHRGVFAAPNCLEQTEIAAAAKAWRERGSELSELVASRGVKMPFVLFVSRLYDENRVDVLLDAAALLLNTPNAIDVVIAGDGPDRERLSEHAARRGLAARVHFVGATYEELELAPWFLSATCFCYPANAGLSLHHAFGYGLPVVVGDALSRHNPEIHAVVPERNGLLFVDGDPQSLAAAVARLLTEPGLRQRLSQGAAKTVSEDFAFERMVDGFESTVRFAYKSRRLTR